MQHQKLPDFRVYISDRAWPQAMPSRSRFRNEKGRPEDRPWTGCNAAPPYAAIATFDFLAARRRANRPAAAAPKSNTIGGAGTSVPPVEPPVEPPFEPPEDDEEPDDDEELLLDDDDEPLEPDEVLPPNEDDVLPPLPPKLDEPFDEEPSDDEPPDDEPDDDELDEEELDEEPLEPELPDEPLEPELPTNR
jgi:hypothetical protein